jgi:hypothetical protein
VEMKAFLLAVCGESRTVAGRELGGGKVGVAARM